MKNIILLTLLVSVNLYAEVTFSTYPIPKKFSSFSGNIPMLKGKGFHEINKQIQKQLLINDNTPIEFSAEKIYQDHEHLSIQVHQEISGGRIYYRDKYYVIDLKDKKLMTLDQVLKKYQLSATTISKQIAEELEPCITSEAQLNEECSSGDREFLYRDFAEDRHRVDLKNADSFYLKKNILGISFDAGGFSVPFEFGLEK
ncbi:hypothetical protein A7P53_06280 [Acinetobacter defluvii]|uniref:DUF4163 domain-containing protein n=1 Tax=Acinetobacter defluvii TaxID=1871111 RepID=A0A2S2FCH7_9GAMM|nr:hypothetical protein [Acinetobacter defluvii]AWL28012.1 hypothetical protein DJ533_05110 [Acinetobacter defluvii]NNP72074.1 hypothetical protein [Acinetobacter defluvii]